MPAPDPIAATLSRFMNSFDLKDWALMRSTLADAIEVDYADLRGEPPRTVSGDEYVASRESALGALSTHHLISNFDIAADRDSAIVQATCMVYRTDGVKSFNSHAFYDFSLRLIDGAWRITRIRQRILWNEGESRLHSGAKT